MKIAIIGAGFTGLSAAYQLIKTGHEVTVFEKDSQPGGLAIGYQEKSWKWTLEKHYHHWFANDKYIIDLAKEINHAVLIPRPKTSVYVDNSIYQLDSPLSVLRFPKLPITDKLRMAAVLGFLKFNPYWQPLEKIHAESFLQKTMGENAYKTLWQPQFHNKFDSYISDISLAWFWARIKKRTPSLVYPEGGFLSFAKHLVSIIEENKGKILFNKEILELRDSGGIKIVLKEKGNKKTVKFDKAIVTLPSFLFQKITPQLPESYIKRLNRHKGLGATNLVLRLSKPFFHDKTYWLSVCDNRSPVMAIVEHTNFMDKRNYNNEHIVYLGNYVTPNHPYFSMTEEDMLSIFDPFLKKINPVYKNNLIGMRLFKAPFAQPIVPVNYSEIMPSMLTPLSNVFLANIEQVYPWDRGTNYAVELGQIVAKLILHEKISSKK